MIIKAISIDKDRGFGIMEFGLTKDLPKEKWVIMEFTADKKDDLAVP